MTNFFAKKRYSPGGLIDWVRCFGCLACFAASNCGGISLLSQPPAPLPRTTTPQKVPLALGPNEHRIFVYDNQGQLLDGNLGGIAGADGLCQQAAQAAGLSELYLAILSDSNTLARDHIAIRGPVYLYSDAYTRTAVTSDSSFWDHEFLTAINITESYRSVPDISIWTGTTEVGNRQGLDCENWTSNHPLPDDPFSQLGGMGRAGLSPSPPLSWSRSNAFESSPHVPCDWKVGGLYCISQGSGNSISKHSF